MSPWGITIGLSLAIGATEPDIVIADFEGHYSPWQVTGDAFGSEPAKTTLPNQSSVGRYEGIGLVNNYCRRLLAPKTGLFRDGPDHGELSQGARLPSIERGRAFGPISRQNLEDMTIPRFGKEAKNKVSRNLDDSRRPWAWNMGRARWSR